MTQSQHCMSDAVFHASKLCPDGVSLHSHGAHINGASYLRTAAASEGDMGERYVYMDMPSKLMMLRIIMQ